MKKQLTPAKANKVRGDYMQWISGMADSKLDYAVGLWAWLQASCPEKLMADKFQMADTLPFNVAGYCPIYLTDVAGFAFAAAQQCGRGDTVALCEWFADFKEMAPYVSPGYTTGGSETNRDYMALYNLDEDVIGHLVCHMWKEGLEAENRTYTK